jgi:predicted acyl esterase
VRAHPLYDAYWASKECDLEAIEVPAFVVASWSDAEDMDLFVAIQKIDHDGSVVPFIFYAMIEDGPAALGWLRVSHRELDEARSRPEQPFHPHTRECLLRPGERVGAPIEIWPSSTRFEAGQKLRVIVQGRDIVTRGLPNAPLLRHEDTRNKGMHVIHTGGACDSYLLIPIVADAR